jgi:hypothetical protein
VLAGEVASSVKAEPAPVSVIETIVVTPAAPPVEEATAKRWFVPPTEAPVTARAPRMALAPSVYASDHAVPLNVHFWIPPPEMRGRSSAT